MKDAAQSRMILVLLIMTSFAITRGDEPATPPSEPGGSSQDRPRMMGQAGYGFLVTEVLNDVVARYSPQGNRVWQYKLARPIDAWPLENGNVLVTFLPDDRSEGQGGVREVTPEGEVVFEHRALGEVMSCQPLPDGRIMAVETSNGRIVELDRSGKIVHAFDLRTKGMGHKTCRLARLTPRGTYLVAETYVNLVREYDRQGNVLREIEAPGCFVADELPGGNILITQYYQSRIFEIDKKDRVVWELTPKDLPEDFKIQHFSEARFLPGGNRLVVNCARDVLPGRVTAFEITPEKKIVWQFRDSFNTREITSIKPIFRTAEK